MIRRGIKRTFSGIQEKPIKKYLARMKVGQQLWEKIVPRTDCDDLNFFKGQKYDQNAIVYGLNIIWDLLDRKGKKIRPVLMMMLGDAYNCDVERSLLLGFVVETVHNCTLIIDDIEDKSIERRGEPCSYLKFGVDNSINAGCLGYFMAIDQAMKMPQLESLAPELKLKLYSTFIEEMKNIHLGLVWDIFWHNNRYNFDSVPDEDNYLKMVESKTSVLLRIGFRFIAISANLDSDETEKMKKLANFIGISFQIQDDLINLESLKYSEGRGGLIGEDITEGKITLMVIHHAKTTRSNSVLDILSQKTTDKVLIEEAISRMRESGSLEYAHKVKENYSKKAQEVLSSLKCDQKVKESFNELLNDLLNREV